MKPEIASGFMSCSANFMNIHIHKTVINALFVFIMVHALIYVLGHFAKYYSILLLHAMDFMTAFSYLMPVPL